MKRIGMTLKRILFSFVLLSGMAAYLPAQVPEGMARIILEVDNLTYQYGVQMFLDSEAESFGVAYDGYYPPSDISSPSGWRGRADFIDTNFDYRIPVEASVADSMPAGVLNGETAILDIPAGTYDYILVYYYYGYMYYVSGDDEKTGNDVVFEEGMTYKYSISSSAMLTYYPPYGIALIGANLPLESHALGTGDPVSIEVVNTGTEPLTAFKAGYSVNGADSVIEEVQCNIPSGDTLEYVFKQNPDFSETGVLEVEFFVQMDKDANTSDNRFSTELYHPAVRPIPFHDDFESGDSLNHWKIEDLGNGYSSGSWRFSRLFYPLAALETYGCIQSSCYSTPAALYLVSDPFQIEEGMQHVSFYYTGGSVSSPEQLELFYGHSPDIASMERVGGVSSITTPLTYGNPATQDYGWELAVFNIDFAKDSVYYFAIGLTTPTQGSHNVYLDEFGIDTGRYDILPDIEMVSLVLPPSSCEMGVDSIGAVIRNAGKAPMAGFEISYSLNGSEWKTYASADSVEIGEMKTVYFADSVNFENIDSYELVVVGTCSGQDIYSNDTLRATVHHYAPITDFPYVADFKDPLGEAREEWHADSTAKWTYDMDGFWTCTVDAGMIHSRCMDFAPGVYRLILRYKAGAGESYYEVYDDFSVGIQALDDTSHITVADMKRQYTRSQEAGFDTVFEIKEAGTYALWLNPYNATNLALAGIEVEEAYYNDIRLESFQARTLAAVMPVQQLDAPHVFSATIRNRGLNEPRNPRLALFVGESDSVEMPVSDSIVYALPLVDAGTVVNVNALALTDTIDAWPEDNLKSVSVLASDSVMATENAVLGKPVTGFFASAPTGNLYVVAKVDTLTSFTFSFAGTELADTLGFYLYSVKEQDGFWYYGDTVYETRFRMPKEQGLATIGIPSTRLCPGTYFAALTDSRMSSGFMSDSSESGVFYSAMYTGQITEVTGQGNMILRLNFGPERSPYAEVDLAVYQISGPQDSTLMTATENLSAQVVNYGNVAVEKVPVIWTIDGMEQVDSVDIQAATAVTLTKVADFSKLGLHELKVEVVWPNDPDGSNNSMSEVFYCMDPNSAIDTTTAISILPGNAVKVYPNPVSSVLIVNSGILMEHAAMFDMQGRCSFVKEGGFTELEIDVEGMPSGTYFLRLSNKEGVIVKKVIVNE